MAYLAPLAACAAALLLASCPRNAAENEGVQPITGKRLRGAVQQQSAPVLYLSGGKLMLMDESGAAKPLTAIGRPEIPVSTFDVNLATGEVALACGGRIGVLSLHPKAQVKPQDEEWHDMRFRAGSDSFIQLVRLSPDATTIYAQVFQAETVDKGFRLLALSRTTQKISEISLPEEVRKMNLRDLKMDSQGTPYFLIYDETVPESIIYKVTDGKAQKVFSSEDALGNGEGDEYGAPIPEAEGAYALEVDDFFPLGNELLMPVFMLVEGKAAETGGNAEELSERTEVWRLDLAGKAISRRYTLSSEPSDTQTDYSFELSGQEMYFARLSFPKPPEPQAAPPAEGKDAQGAQGDSAEETANDEPPKDFTIMRLDLATGEISKAFTSPLNADFFGVAIFANVNALGVLHGSENALKLDCLDFSGKKLQTGVSVDSPDVYFLASSK